MKKSFLSVLLLSIFISAPVFADKPGWTGKEKATEEKKEAHKEAMKAKRGSENEGKEKNKEIKEQFIKKEGEPAAGQSGDEWRLRRGPAGCFSVSGLLRGAAALLVAMAELSELRSDQGRRRRSSLLLLLEDFQVLPYQLPERS